MFLYSILKYWSLVNFCLFKHILIETFLLIIERYLLYCLKIFLWHEYKEKEDTNVYFLTFKKRKDLWQSKEKCLKTKISTLLPAGQMQLATCFCMASKLRKFFTVFNGWKIFKIIWHMKYKIQFSLFINKILKFVKNLWNYPDFVSWSTKAKIFTIWLFREKVCQLQV